MAEERSGTISIIKGLVCAFIASGIIIIFILLTNNTNEISENIQEELPLFICDPQFSPNGYCDATISCPRGECCSTQNICGETFCDFDSMCSTQCDGDPCLLMVGFESTAFYRGAKSTDQSPFPLDIIFSKTNLIGTVEAREIYTHNAEITYFYGWTKPGVLSFEITPTNINSQVLIIFPENLVEDTKSKRKNQAATFTIEYISTTSIISSTGAGETGGILPQHPPIAINTPYYFNTCGLGKKKAALTFDDGPMPITSYIIDELNNYGVTGTFFVIGRELNGLNSNIIKKMAQSGHIIGSHTWDHISFKGANNEEISIQLEMTALAIETAIGFRPIMKYHIMKCIRPKSRPIMIYYRPKFVRPPYLELNASQLNLLINLGYYVSLPNVDSNDWSLQNASLIVSHLNQTISSMSPNPIVILQHDTYTTPFVVRSTIELLHYYGYNIVGLNSCFA